MNAVRYRIWVVCTLALTMVACRPTTLPDEITWLPWGHNEATVTADGALQPRWIGPGRTLGVCLDAPLDLDLDLDLSQWRVQLRVREIDEPAPPFDAPRSGAGTTLCFGRSLPEALATLPPPHSFTVCPTVHDPYDDRRYTAPCFAAHFEADNPRFEQLSLRAQTIIGNRDAQPPVSLVVALDDVADDAARAGFPFLSVFPRLVAVHQLRGVGTHEALVQAERRLRKLPSWLAHPWATAPAIPVALERANVARARGLLRAAWDHLDDADRLVRRYASARRIAVATAQANILVQLGQRDEPLRRLATALEACERWRCDPSQVPLAHGLYAWLILVDPDATSEALERARASLTRALDADSIGADSTARDAAEEANLHINRALLASRTGNDPEPHVTRARTLLTPLRPTPRRDSLRLWADVVTGLDALARGHAERALTTCVVPRRPGAFPHAASWGWSCRGQAYRRLGQASQAGEAFAQAVHWGVTAQISTLGQDLPLAPGHLADNFFRAARVAVERGQPGQAWALLDSLDEVAARAPCRVTHATPGSTAKRDGMMARERRREVLQDQLTATEPPLAPARARQLAPVREALLESLEETLRVASAPCGPLPTDTAPPADLRAIPLPDEIILLARDPRGHVSVERRTPLRRNQLHGLLERLEAALEQPTSEAAWRSLASPLAQALVPSPVDQLGPVTRYALHGSLQRVPISALPIGDPDGDAWLLDHTVPVLRPSLATAGPTLANAATPLFVVDPRRDLPTGAQGRIEYLRRFPNARMLYGDAATRAGLRSALQAGLSFLHVDAHGQKDPAFIQLAGLILNDGLFTMADWPDDARVRDFVNLSSCHVGRGTPSGDSGRYGFAGALVSRGVPWVVASSATLDDRLAYAFNQAFYTALARRSDVARSDVPRAFADALAVMRRDHGVAVWARLRLLGTGEGKTRSDVTTLDRGRG